MCKLFQGLCIFLVSFDTSCGLKWVKTSSKIHIKFISGYLTFSLG